MYQVGMRGDDLKQAAMFSYITLARRIPADHPARQIRVLVDRALGRMDGELEELYSATGRPSIAPDGPDSVFARLFSYVVMGVAFCGLGVVVAARPALTILAAPAFRGAAAIVPPLVAAGWFRPLLAVVRG